MKSPVKNCKWTLYPHGDMTQYFAENQELYQKYSSTIAHNGVDIVRPHGEHLFAVEDGIIVSVKEDPSGYGKNVRLLSFPDKDGLMRDWVYGHLHSIHVSLGETVRAGQFIATMGNTGFVVSNSNGNGFWSNNPYAGTHLHIGVRNVKHDKDGWKYEGYKRGLCVIDYENGYKGRYDPLPLFVSPVVLKWICFARKNGGKPYWQLANLLQVINV